MITNAQAATLLVYEHKDGRYLVTCPRSATVAGDPQWHRLGPATVETAAAPACTPMDGRSDLPSRPTTKQLRLICELVAERAHRLEREFLFFFGVGDVPGEVSERTALFLDGLRDAINYLGWLAEQGAPGVMHEDSREFLLPPRFFDD